MLNLHDVFDGFGFVEGESFVESHGSLILLVHSCSNRAGVLFFGVCEETLVQFSAYPTAPVVLVHYNRLELCDFAFPVNVQIEAADNGADQFIVLFRHENAVFFVRCKSCEDVSQVWSYIAVVQLFEKWKYSWPITRCGSADSEFTVHETVIMKTLIQTFPLDLTKLQTKATE